MRSGTHRSIRCRFPTNDDLEEFSEVVAAGAHSVRRLAVCIHTGDIFEFSTRLATWITPSVWPRPFFDSAGRINLGLTFSASIVGWLGPEYLGTLLNHESRLDDCPFPWYLSQPDLILRVFPMMSVHLLARSVRQGGLRCFPVPISDEPTDKANYYYSVRRPQGLTLSQIPRRGPIPIQH